MGEVKTIRHDWRDIFRAFKMAFDPKKMFLGYSALLASLFWCTIVVALFSALKLISTTPCTFIRLVLCSAREGVPVIARNISHAIMPLDFGELFALSILIFGILAIWSLAGGAITRISAVDYAKDESICLIDALKFSRKKFWSYFWSPLVPVIGVFFFALCNVIGGLLGRIPVFGEILVALGFPFALISGFLMVFIGIIGVLGLCFMFPTISAEGSDAFDAMSRAYSYVISRPKQFILYCVINTLYGFVCLIFIACIAWLVVRLSFYTIGIGMGQKFGLIQSFLSQKCNIACLGFCNVHSPQSPVSTASLNWSLKFLAGMLIVYIVLIKLTVWTFVLTYLFSAKTIIYFLLRKDIDSTDINDVYIEEEKTERSNAEVKTFSPSGEGNKDDSSPDKESRL
ncbi:MAG: hypothetical protein QY310_03890 [Candidatus Jettenia sp. CY-1]|nr:MAG: hypothetical protein QY310_03890 [Candidatus Jettenia sp. CY-1]